MAIEVVPRSKYDDVVSEQALNMPHKIRNIYIGGSLCRGYLMAPDDFNEAVEFMTDMLTKVYDNKLDITACRQEWAENHKSNCATIYGRSGSLVYVSIFIDDMEHSLVIPDSPLGKYTKFSFYFPAKALKQQTKEAVPEIWNLVEGIEFRKADKELDKLSGDGNIILSDPPLISTNAVPERRIIASGYPALEKMKINVEKRPVFLYDIRGD